MAKTIIMSLGGSLIVPDDIDVDFLRRFRGLIKNYIAKEYRFVIYAGGGRTARKYQQAASEITKVDNEDLDWIGIHATRLNAHLLRTIFKDEANSAVLDNPNKKIDFKKNVIIASGWIPGWSTDYDAVIVAKRIKAKEIVNLSNVDYVYDKDPIKNPDAKSFERISWDEYRKLIDAKWRAGLNAPFDPVASKEAHKLKLRVAIIGKNLDNLKNCLDGKSFNGTVII